MALFPLVDHPWLLTGPGPLTLVLSWVAGVLSWEKFQGC